MGLMEDVLKDSLGPGVALGLGAILLVPTVLPALGTILRPIAKAAIKGGLIVYEKSGAVVGEARETLSDLVAESRNELAAPHEG